MNISITSLHHKSSSNIAGFLGGIINNLGLGVDNHDLKDKNNGHGHNEIDDSKDKNPTLQKPLKFFRLCGCTGSRGDDHDSPLLAF